MLWLILTIIVTAGLFIGFGFKLTEDEDSFYWKRNRKQFAAVIGLIFLVIGCTTRIPANSVGIVYSTFGGTKQETLSEGMHIKNIFDKVYKISTEVQTVSVENLTTQTMDAQYVTSVLDIKYKVSEENAYVVFKQFRNLKNVSDNLIIPTTQRALEHITTKYNVIDILGEERSSIYSELELALAEELTAAGIEFYSITINDMDAGEKLEAVIAEEAVAKKAVETAQQDLLKAQTEAQKKSVEAQAEQDAAKIKAETLVIEAEAEKEANELLNKSLTDHILRMEWIHKWDGQMPTYYGGDGVDLMVGVE